MKEFCHCARVWLVILGLAAVFAGTLLHGAPQVGPPNILWHHRASAENRLWVMNRTNVTAEIPLPANPDDPTWKMIGTGDFNRDGEPDIVWRNETTGQNAVWYMKGAVPHLAALIQPARDLNWKMVGVADFNGDGHPDLLWQNVVVGQNAVWIMDGITPQAFPSIPWAGDPNWRIVATGDINRDGKPDIILRNQSSGQNAVWYMDGLKMISGDMLRTRGGAEASEKDIDWQIVGTGDYNADGNVDLLWRHCTLGVNVVWFLQGNVVLASTYLGRHEYDTDWRISSQETAECVWRLRNADFTYLRATVSTNPPRVVLTYKLPPNPGSGVTVQRRLTTESNWTTLASGFQGDYTDSTVTLGRNYEYRIWREGFLGAQYSAAEHLCVGLNPAPIEDRGQIILLVDQTLASQLTPGLAQLSRDLIGDGWRVVRHDVPRHVDDYSTTNSFWVNAGNITNIIKPLILSEYARDTNTRAIFIIGHVAIPYSGAFNPDGHNCGPRPFGPDHRGAWPADMFYGDVDGIWTDHRASIINCEFLEPNNVPGDGKFDQDVIAPPFIMRLAVGRIDFARLPLLTENPPPGIAPRTEAALILQYLSKNHSYRFGLLNWQQTPAATRAMVYGHFHDARDNQIFENARHAMNAISHDPDRLFVGDFLLQRTKPALWGFLAGPGLWDRINEAYPVLEHTSADLAHPANEPRAAFCLLLASFVGDWNLRTNNYLRMLLAAPNFGLASMWTRFGLWRIDSMGLGEHLGMAHLRMVNDPKNTFFDRSRDLTILGDPSLRLHVLPPPTGVRTTRTETEAQISWAPAAPGTFHYVYRAPSFNGPFRRISTSAIAGNRFNDGSPLPNERIYMVRALKSARVENAFYTNISQGVYTSF